MSNRFRQVPTKIGQASKTRESLYSALYKYLTTTQALQGTDLVLCTDELGDQRRRTTSLQQHLHQVSVPAQRRKVQSSATILRESASPHDDQPWISNEMHANYSHESRFAGSVMILLAPRWG